MFSNTERHIDAGQISVDGGLLIDSIVADSICHAATRFFHKVKRPVKSVVFADIFAAWKAIDTGKMIIKVYETLLDADTDHVEVVDSKVTFTDLTRHFQWLSQFVVTSVS